MPYLFQCTACNEYTLDDTKCPKCNGAVRSPVPPKYSPQDKYGEYRRKAKRKSRQMDTT